MNNPKLAKMATAFETWMFSFAKKNCAFIVCYHFHSHSETKCFLKYSIVFVHTFKMCANGTVEWTHLRAWDRESGRERVIGMEKEIIYKTSSISDRKTLFQNLFIRYIIEIFFIARMCWNCQVVCNKRNPVKW